MIFTLFRTLNAIFAVVVAILISRRLGESASGKIVTVLITSGVVALFEWLMTWTPRRFAWVRQLLDQRALFSGVWLQEVKTVYGSEGRKQDHPNRFGLFSVKYDQGEDNYKVSGSAYTDSGQEHAQWDSTEVVHFSKSGRSMSYEWVGTLISESGSSGDPADPRRQGFTSLKLTSDNAGRGRVDHVAVNVILEFDLTRITADWLAENNLRVKPETLHDPSKRDAFALGFAKIRGRRKAARA